MTAECVKAVAESGLYVSSMAMFFAMIFGLALGGLATVIALQFSKGK